MRTVTFQSVFEAILQRHGLDPAGDAINHDTARAITQNINRRVRSGWEMWDFSELSKTEERAFRSVWNSTRQFRRAGDDNGQPDELYYLANQKYYAVKSTAPSDPPVGTLPTNTTYFAELISYEPFIDRDQPCKRALGQILGIYGANPSLNGNCADGCLSYRPSERGVWLNGNFGKTVFVWYLLPPSQFTMVPWIEGKAYTRGQRVFYTVDGNCYRCIEPTSAAAPSDANYWTMEPMPELLADYIEAGAYADCLREGPFNAGEVVPRMQAAGAAADEAESYLHHEIDKQLIQGERHYYIKPSWWRWSYNNAGCNGAWCNSRRWGGDRVMLLNDACETTWVYPPGPFTEFIRIEEVEGIISGVTQLVEGQDYIDVVFGTDQPTADWVLLEASISNTVDGAPVNVWPGVVTSKTTGGFRLQLNGVPDSANYILNWSIRGVFGYYLSGPSSGAAGVPSANFTVRLPDETTMTGTVVITPSDGGAGGVFTPASVALTAAAPVATFTYTPSTYGARGIRTTNDKGLVNPPQIGYNSLTPTYTLSGPSTGAVGVASTNFTVALVGTALGTVTVTPSDGGDGGTFTPTSIGLTNGSPSATFTYTPASLGSKTISTTNNAGLPNPGSLTYNSVPDQHLLNTLVSYWKLDEASGTRVDSHSSNDLTDNNTVMASAAKINNGALFVKANSEYLSHASNASLQMSGNTDFTISAWVKFTTIAGGTAHEVVSKDDSAANSRDYNMECINDGGGTGFVFHSQSGGVMYIAKSATTPSAGVWYHLVGWYDSSNGQCHLRINDATTYNSATGATGADVSAAEFRIGARQYSGAEDYCDGIIDEVGIWKRKLTADEITALYNGGAGFPYSSFLA